MPNTIRGIVNFVSGIGLLLFGLAWITTIILALSGVYSASIATGMSWGGSGMLISLIVWLATLDDNH